MESVCYSIFMYEYVGTVVKLKGPLNFFALRVSRATTIMISALLKDSSGGFGSSICTNDYENHIQDTNLVTVKQF